MSEAEEAKQRRREKIMARMGEQSEEPLPQAPAETSQPNVFDRYKQLKNKQKNQNILNEVSKAVGILIVLISFFLPPDAVFTLILLALLTAAIQLSAHSSDSPQKNSAEGEWLTKLIPIVSQIKHAQRWIFVAKIGLNVSLSYLVAAVLANVVWISASNLGEL